MTIFSVSTVYKDYQAGGGKKNAKQSRQGHHHSIDEREAGGTPAPSAGPSTASTTGSVGDNDGAIGKAINVTA